MNLDAYLPAALRGRAATITGLADGLSGARVYRVEVAGHAVVLKIAPASEPPADWRRTLRIQQLAADAGLAPRVVHADEARRAVVSAFVAGRSFTAAYRDPRTREAALARLGRTVRRVHALPPPRDTETGDPRGRLAALWSAVGAAGGGADFAVPAFVGDAVRRVLAETAPARERALVLSHNDVHPGNLVDDGERLLLLDWAAAGLNDAFHDLAAIAVFLDMDAGACRRLLAAYEGAPVGELPAGFVYHRRLVSVLCGTNFLTISRRSGHRGATGAETLGAVPSLGAFYGRVRSGALSLATGEGQWEFGLALLKAGAAP